MKENRTTLRFLSLVLLAAVLFSCRPKTAETAEAFYGPSDKVYQLPAVTSEIFYVAPDGKADADGSDIQHPTTVESAISKAATGDAIIMRGGVYRTGYLTFNQGITIQPYRDEHPVLKGTLVADNWEKAGDSLWVTHWEFLFPAGPESWWNRAREEQFTPLHRFNNDGVFIDGRYLRSAGSKNEVDEGTFFVDYDGKQIYIGIDPAGKLVEITAFRKAIFRTTADVHGKRSDKRGPKIYGLEITQYPDTMVHIDGFYPQGISPEEQNGKDVVGTLFDNCTFSDCFRIGVFAIGDSLVMRNCLVKNTNTEGVYIVASSDVLLERNIFTYNNIEKWTGFYPGAVKIFNQTHRVTCRENKIIDLPFSHGIWYDVGNVDGVFVNNWAERVGTLDKPFFDHQVWPADNAFFFEISNGAVCAGNVFLNCDQVFVLNSCDVKVYNNTFINTRFGFGRDARGDNADLFGWHVATGPAVDERQGHVFVNNLMVVEEELMKPLLFVWQPSYMCQRLKKSQLEMLDHNVYMRRRNASHTPLILWSPAENEKCLVGLHSNEELTRLYPDYSQNSQYLEDYTGAVFVDTAKGDFHLLKELAGKFSGIKPPDEIIKAMQLSDEGSSFVGAYPVK